MTRAKRGRLASAPEIAKLVGCSQTVVYKHISKSEVAPISKRGKTALYDVEEVVDTIAANRARDKNHTPNEIRNQKTRLEVEILEIKRRQLLNDLVDAETVRRRSFQIYRAVRESVLALPENVADMLAAETDPDSVEALLLEELREVLDGLSRVPLDELEDEDEIGADQEPDEGEQVQGAS